MSDVFIVYRLAYTVDVDLYVIHNSWANILPPFVGGIALFNHPVC
jgi:hypothetical protein